MSLRALASGVVLAGMLCANDASAQLLSRPVTCAGCITDWYYVDQGSGNDYTCGFATYADHSGTDYSLENGNFAIDDDNEVVAMAAGTVVHAEDGYYDRCTQCGGFNCGLGQGNGFANQVIINHGAYRTIYGHMKSGSIAVAEGDTVECGDVIGFIGSSGCSTGAHLHIEPSLAASFNVGPYEFIDPYVGACSPTPASLWLDQGPYEGLPGSACDDSMPTPTCPADTYPIWTCTTDMQARRRCVDGVVTDEPCPAGCNVMPTGTDDVCALPPDGDADGSRADTDCDDADATRHPGALEVCGDGIDQACSGSDMVCPPPVVPPPPTAGASGGGAAALPTGGAAGFVGPALPAGGVGGQPASGFGAQAGFAAPVVVPTSQPILPTTRSAVEASGCRVHAGARSGGMPGAASWAWLLGLGALAVRARRATRRCARPRLSRP